MLRTCGKARRFSPSIATLPAAAYSQVCWTGATSVSEEHAPVLGIMRLACCSLSEIRSPAKNAERQDFTSRGLNQRYLSACLYRILGHAEPYCIEASANSLCTLNPWGTLFAYTHCQTFLFFQCSFRGDLLCISWPETTGPWVVCRCGKMRTTASWIAAKSA